MLWLEKGEMKVKRFLFVCFAVVLSVLFLSACSSPDTSSEQQNEAYSYTYDAENLTTYPLTENPDYAAFATSVPDIIYTTTGEENGLIGNIYRFSGTVKSASSFESDGSEYKYIIVQTDCGDVMVGNVFEVLWQNLKNEEHYGDKLIEMTLGEKLSDYVFPDIGEQAEFICSYVGFSDVYDCPSFMLGGNKFLLGTSAEAEGNLAPEVREDTGTMPDSAAESENDAKTDNDAKIENGTKTDNGVKNDDRVNNSAGTKADGGSTAESTSQSNAVRTAKSYLNVMAFSRDGLIDQLEYEGFSNADAVYGVDNCDADWNEQAEKSAKSYLKTMSFSYNGLIEQLKYEGFTHEQAVYGVSCSGADWNEQAAQAAKEYLDIMSFSRSGLIEQLVYEGFTYAQAEYGADANGF